MKIILALVVVFFLLFLLGLCCFLLSFWGWSGEATKGSPFECGFSPLSSANLSFSMPFFFVSLMFLLFDVEILLLCFYPFTLVLDPSGSVVIFFVVFLILFSTLYEWVKGVLIWV